ncbi:MAG: hypothetical protein QOE90_227 [Thermoplasmata archaeon]|jgi:DNA-binding MarR family transcriptional regulator|nr:hypothetical protein [Thermoplasmata archaeon]
MMRLFAFLLAASFLAPVALAAAPADAAPQVPVPLARAMHQAGDAAAGAASVSASGAAAAGHALSTVASAAGRALVAAGQAVGGALAFVGSALAGFARKGAQYAISHPEETADAAGAAAGFGMLFWVAKRLGAFGALAPLYMRLAPSEMLDNEARNRVYEHVKAHPGAHPSAIAETLDLGWGTVVYHLSKLESTRLVTSRTAHNRKCFFAMTGELDAQARTAVAAMSTDKARAIVDAVRAAPGISQKDLSERLGISQALASWHVKRLVESGVLNVAKSGRSHTLHVAGHVPVLVTA